MDIPQIPTDNLYKFIALSGILIAVLSIAIPLAKIDRIEQQVYALKIQAAKLSVETDILSDEIGLLKRTNNVQQDASLREKFSELRTKIAEQHAIQDQLDQRISKISNSYRIIGIGIFIGIFLAITGFQLWYLKLQRYLRSGCEIKFAVQ